MRKVILQSSVDGLVIDHINDETKAINGRKAKDVVSVDLGSECNEQDGGVTTNIDILGFLYKLVASVGVT
jgi:hypothetical protein